MFCLVLPPHWERPGVLAEVASPGSLWHPGHAGCGQGAAGSKGTAVGEILGLGNDPLRKGDLW